jgi:hypothetical protein
MQEVWSSNPHSSTPFPQVSGHLDHELQLPFSDWLPNGLPVGLELLSRHVDDW